MSTTIADLQHEIALAYEHDEIDTYKRPSISHVIALGRAWRLVGETHFENRVARRGWKCDFIRAGKHFFLSFACANVTGANRKIDDSRLMPARVVEMVTRYLNGEIVAVYAESDDYERIARQEQRFLEVADVLDLYYNNVCDLAEALCLKRAQKWACRRESLRTKGETRS